jgi:hypothetical protein
MAQHSVSGAESMKYAKHVDSKGRLTLGESFANHTVLVESHGEDEVLIKRARVIPERESWLYENKAALASVRRGLAQAAEGQFAKGPDTHRAATAAGLHTDSHAAADRAAVPTGAEHMRTFTRTHERRVEKLAKAVEKSRSYDQHIIEHRCGTPGCMIGHAQVVFKSRSKYIKYGAFLPLRTFLFGPFIPGVTAAAGARSRDFTSAVGCDYAGRSGKKAAAFIRKMAADLKAAQS